MPLFAGNGIVNAQPETAGTFIAPENEFTMSVVREKGDIIITVVFADSLQFEYAAIEREAEFDNNFSQCSYIDYSDVKSHGMKIRRKDNYPYPATSDVLYRLKITMNDGITRIYPPVQLPAFNNKRVVIPTETGAVGGN